MAIVVTGGDGFIGRNLRVRLAERGRGTVASVTRATGDRERQGHLANAEIVFHLAGVNRPPSEADFAAGNADFTARLCDELRATGRAVPLVFTSSTQALLDNPYGRSKRAAEQAVERYGRDTGAPVAILRLTNVFGKWCRPNYNSVVATFCHNAARGLPLSISDRAAPLRLVYVDDVVDAMLHLLESGVARTGLVEVGPVHDTTVGELADAVTRLAENRRTLVIPRVGTGFLRALYATYVSSLPPDDLSYPLVRHADPRGMFAEMLRTLDSGQVSFFTAGPGVTRGGHYHHTKAEKFLVVQGRARFGLRHLVTDERRTIDVRGDDARVVEMVPGWVHDITNVGDETLVVLLWSSEQFDPGRPDTIASAVNP